MSNHYNNNGKTLDVVTWAKSQGLDVEGFCRINALKYLTRAGKKKGESKEKDYKKALDYVHYLVHGSFIKQKPMAENHDFGKQPTFDELIEHVTQWAKDKNILSSLNVRGQIMKVMEEVGELSGAILKGNKAGILDGLGDSFVTLIILAAQLDLDATECLQAAWDEIKNRTGKTKDGVFVKD